MAVYVDDMRARFGRMIMCHMIADSSDELHAMAARIGLPRRWCQAAGTYREHYDVSLSVKAKAIAAGAVEIPQRQLGVKIVARRVFRRLALVENESAAAPIRNENATAAE